MLSTTAPVPPIPPMVVEEHPESSNKRFNEPIIQLDPLRVIYSFALQRRNLKLWRLKIFISYQQRQIQMLLISLKCSTNYIEKLAIEDVKVALEVKD